MGFEKEPSFDYESSEKGNESLMKNFEKDAELVEEGNADSADEREIEVPQGEAVGKNSADNGFLQDVVQAGAEAKEKEVQDKKSADKTAEELIKKLDQPEKSSNKAVSSEVAPSTAEKASEVKESVDVAQAEIAEKHEELAERTGSLLSEGSDSSEA